MKFKISQWQTKVACSLLIVLLNACSSLPTDPNREDSYVITNTADTALGQALAEQLAQHPGESGFFTLNEGMNAFAARLFLISVAQKSIDVQYYIWHDDGTGKVLYNQLLAAADRGVRVRILLDDLDTAGKDNLLRAVDAHPMVEIRLFNPFSKRTSRAGDLITDTARINRRMHNKTLTVDNQATIFGGRNIGNEYFDAQSDVGFSDLDALAIGPIAGEVSDSFDLYWNSEWAHRLAAFYPGKTLGSEQIQAFRKASDEHLEEAQSTHYAQAVRTQEVADIDRFTALDFAWSPWILAYDQPSKVVAESVDEETHLAPRLQKAIDRAQNELIIVSPYFVPGEDFSQYLVDRVAGGLRVRILTNSLSANDVAMVHAGYIRYREKLVSGGVELYEYKASKTDQADDNRKSPGASQASLHAKFLGFDQRYMFIGSFNLDARSVALNTELGAYFQSTQHARQLSNAFDSMLLKNAYRLSIDDDGNLQWTTLEGDDEQHFDHEPETSFWQRMNSGFMSLIVPESLL